ncbi:hypothetical protein MTO96_034632 [Rhipicephalus appendiculatus]
MDAFIPAEIAAYLLKCTPLVVIVLFGSIQTAPNNYPKLPSGPYWTLLDATHMDIHCVYVDLVVVGYYSDDVKTNAGCFNDDVANDLGKLFPGATFGEKVADRSQVLKLRTQVNVANKRVPLLVVDELLLNSHLINDQAAHFGLWRVQSLKLRFQAGA